MKHILIISYTFPPNPGIGGRRWAKFAKYLTRQNFTVHVIHAAIKNQSSSLWYGDVCENTDIIRYPVKTYYPQILVSNPDTFLKKLKYRISDNLLKLTTNGTPYDVAIGWRQPLLKKANELIQKHAIKNVIVSCAPFRSAVYALELKRENKNLNLLVDFRDPWTWGKGYGMTLLSAKKLQAEKELEKKVMDGADSIFVPVTVMQQHLNQTYPQHTRKIKLLQHAFDEDEVKPQPKTKSDKIRLVFFGSIYKYLEIFMAKLAKELKKYENEYTLDFYSDSQNYSHIFEQQQLLNKQVNYHENKPAAELFKSFADYDFVLLVHPDYGKHNIATKFYEIIYSKTPMLYIGNPGLTANFIESNNIGLSYNADNLDLNPEKIRSWLAQEKTEFKEIYQYSFASQTQNLINNFS